MADRTAMLQEINEISFTINDLTLYLDTHPTEEAALAQFKEAMQKRKDLLKAYAKEFEPLTVDCVCPDTNNQSNCCSKYAGRKHFTWSDGPLPWEGGSI